MSSVNNDIFYFLLSDPHTFYLFPALTALGGSTEYWTGAMKAGLLVMLLLVYFWNIFLTLKFPELLARFISRCCLPISFLNFPNFDVMLFLGSIISEYPLVF